MNPVVSSSYSVLELKVVLDINSLSSKDCTDGLRSFGMQVRSVSRVSFSKLFFKADFSKLAGKGTLVYVIIHIHHEN